MASAEAEALAKAWWEGHPNSRQSQWEDASPEVRALHCEAAAHVLMSADWRIEWRPFDPAEAIARLHREQWEQVTTSTVQTMIDRGLIEPGPNLEAEGR